MPERRLKMSYAGCSRVLSSERRRRRSGQDRTIEAHVANRGAVIRDCYSLPQLAFGETCDKPTRAFPQGASGGGHATENSRDTEGAREIQSRGTWRETLAHSACTSVLSASTTYHCRSARRPKLPAYCRYRTRLQAFAPISSSLQIHGTIDNCRLTLRAPCGIPRWWYESSRGSANGP